MPVELAAAWHISCKCPMRAQPASHLLCVGALRQELLDNNADPLIEKLGRIDAAQSRCKRHAGWCIGADGRVCVQPDNAIAHEPVMGRIVPRQSSPAACLERQLSHWMCEACARPADTTRLYAGICQRG